MELIILKYKNPQGEEMEELFNFAYVEYRKVNRSIGKHRGGERLTKESLLLEFHCSMVRLSKENVEHTIEVR
jgi:hypothetical protein|tara:strand:- start:279 stop:494 length:216 start_codon:yes stop_codon:yes gene_type:complete